MTGNFLVGQKMVEIKLSDHSTSMNPGYGNLIPINQDLSLLNLDNTRLFLVDNSNGKIHKEFPEQQMEEALDNFLLHKFGSTISRYNEKERIFWPYCNNNQFQYSRFYRVNNQLACQVDVPLKVPGVSEEVLFHFIVYFDQKLRVKEIYHREFHSSAVALSPDTEAFFLGKNSLFIGKNNHFHNDFANFVEFRLEGNTYKLVEELSLIPEILLFNYFTGRHLTKLENSNSLFLHNGKRIFETSPNLQECLSEIPFDIKQNELFTDLKVVHESILIGIKIQVNNEGVALSEKVFLFLTDFDFKENQIIKKYDALRYRVNSMETLNGSVYLFIYDRKNKKYLIEIINIRKDYLNSQNTG